MVSVTELLLLMFEFFKTGLFAVGGGLATIPFLKEMAEKYYEAYNWFSVSELTDMIAVSESTPGPIGVNMATYAGFNMGFSDGGILAGILCGILATLSLVTPSLIVILIVAKFLEKFKNNKLVDGAFYGIRPCSAALITAAMLDVLIMSVFTFSSDAQKLLGFITVPQSVNYIAIIFFALMIPIVVKFKKVHPIVFIALGAVVGIIFKL